MECYRSQVCSGKLLSLASFWHNGIGFAFCPLATTVFAFCCSCFLLPIPVAIWQCLRSRRINHKTITLYSYFSVSGQGSLTLSEQSPSQWEKIRCYICNVFPYWLRPSSDIGRNRRHICNRSTMYIPCYLMVSHGNANCYCHLFWCR